MKSKFKNLNSKITKCKKCSRLVKFRNKIAVEDANKKLSFSQLKFKSQKIGSLITSLFNVKFQNQPIVIFLPKSTDALISFFGTLYSYITCVKQRIESFLTPPFSFRLNQRLYRQQSLHWRVSF